MRINTIQLGVHLGPILNYELKWGSTFAAISSKGVTTLQVNTLEFQTTLIPKQFLFLIFNFTTLDTQKVQDEKELKK